MTLMVCWRNRELTVKHSWKRSTSVIMKSCPHVFAVKYAGGLTALNCGRGIHAKQYRPRVAGMCCGRFLLCIIARAMLSANLVQGTGTISAGVNRRAFEWVCPSLRPVAMI